MISMVFRPGWLCQLSIPPQVKNVQRTSISIHHIHRMVILFEVRDNDLFETKEVQIEARKEKLIINKQKNDFK